MRVATERCVWGMTRETAKVNREFSSFNALRTHQRAEIQRDGPRRRVLFHTSLRLERRVRKSLHIATKRWRMVLIAANRKDRGFIVRLTSSSQCARETLCAKLLWREKKKKKPLEWESNLSLCATMRRVVLMCGKNEEGRDSLYPTRKHIGNEKRTASKPVVLFEAIWVFNHSSASVTTINGTLHRSLTYGRSAKWRARNKKKKKMLTVYTKENTFSSLHQIRVS
jgi:hypothetical protein